MPAAAAASWASAQNSRAVSIHAAASSAVGVVERRDVDGRRPQSRAGGCGPALGERVRSLPGSARRAAHRRGRGPAASSMIFLAWCRTPGSRWSITSSSAGSATTRSEGPCTRRRTAERMRPRDGRPGKVEGEAANPPFINGLRSLTRHPGHRAGCDALTATSGTAD